MRIVLPLLLLGTNALAEPALKKSDALKAVRATVKDAKGVSEIFTDVGEGRLPILFVVKGKDCHNDAANQPYCSDTTAPHAGILKRAADGTVALEGELALPVAAVPWDAQDPFKWGVTTQKDHDGDGKPELFVVYGYCGPTQPGVGNICYRDAAIINLDKLSLGFHATLDERPEASVFPLVETKWKLTGPLLVLTRRVGEHDDKTGERAFTEKKSTWRWDAAKDAYVEDAAKK